MTVIPHCSYLPAGSVANFYLVTPSFRAWVVPIYSTDRETEAQRAYLHSFPQVTSKFSAGMHVALGLPNSLYWTTWSVIYPETWADMVKNLLWLINSLLKQEWCNENQMAWLQTL